MGTAMVIILKNWASLIANAIIPVAIIVFASGFFPYKAMLPGLARLDGSNSATIPPAIFDKVIFMVVDALRRYGYLRFSEQYSAS